MGEPVDLNKRCENSAAPMDGRRSCTSFPGCGCAAEPLPSSVKPSDTELAALLNDDADWITKLGSKLPSDYSVEIATRLRLAASRLSVPTWLPIETAPKDGKKVLLTWRTDSDNYRGVSVAFWAERDTAMDNAVGWFDYDWNMIADDTQALGWMPCPAPLPKAPASGNGHGGSGA